MCINPLLLPSGDLVSCRECWQCRQNRVNEWVGRCIAELETTPAGAHIATLTYGGDDKYYALGEPNLHARILIYKDVVEWLGRLRKIAPLRYMICGEYGTEKGRSHWHAICFWQEKPPPNLVLETRYIHEAPPQPGRERGRRLWEHGFTYWEEATEGRMRYALKYLLKDQYQQGFDRSTRAFSVSRRPALGSKYFADLARRYAVARLSPQDLLYRFAGSTMASDDKKPFEYMIRSKALIDTFLGSFVDAWNELHPNENWPYSELVSDWLDSQAARPWSVRDELEMEKKLWRKGDQSEGAEAAMADTGPVHRETVRELRERLRTSQLDATLRKSLTPSNSRVFHRNGDPVRR